MDYIPSRVFPPINLPRLGSCCGGFTCEISKHFKYFALNARLDIPWISLEYSVFGSRQNLQENAYLIFVRTSMKCADVEQGPQRRPTTCLKYRKEWIQISVQKRHKLENKSGYNTPNSIGGVEGVDFTVLKLISELIDQGLLEGLLIKREGWLNGWTGVISPHRPRP